MGEQAQHWDDRAEAWARHADDMNAFSRQFGGPAIDALDPAPAQQLADVGCGPGTTTIELGARVAPGGSVTGVDISPGMVEAATRRAEAAGADNVTFEVGDPGAGPIGSFDGIHSRFGVMFFDDPATAFTNLRRSIRPGGRFAAAVWAELEANPWMFLPNLIGAEVLEAELTAPEPGEPGPFSLADAEATATLLETCGFREVDVVRQEHVWTFDADTAAAAIGRMLAIGPVGEAWDAADDDTRAAAVEATRAACEEFRDGTEWRLPAAALVLSASVPR